MRTILIERKKNFFKCLSVYEVYCDGKIVATLRNGAEVILEIDDNPHTIYCVSSGGDSRTVSDLINIPSGSQSVKLIAKRLVGSIRLEFNN